MGKAKKPAVAAGKSSDHLNGFLRGEMAAVATYKLALDHLESATHARSNLEACLQSHQQRVSLLRAAISERGGTPDAAAGAWATIVQIVDASDEAFGDREAIAALVDGEDQGLAGYRSDLAGLDASTRQLVELQILPKQIQTQYMMSELKEHLH